jgi:hypothetical protein
MSKEAGRSMYANIVVEDLAGLGMSHMYTPGIDLFKRVIAMDQANYPDTLKVQRSRVNLFALSLAMSRV